MRIAFSIAFQESVDYYFTEDSLAHLIRRLIEAPYTGALVRGLRGMRKIRAPDTVFHIGTRSGLRVIYSYDHRKQLIVLYFTYRKRDQPDLLPHQRAYLIHLSLIDIEDEDLWHDPRNN